MYLLTFTFLIISMLGVYTQVMAVEASRLYASQTGIGQDMVYWHEASVSLAENVVNPTSISAAGCSLTYTGTNANYCKSGPNVEPLNSNVTTNGAVTPITYTVTPPGALGPSSYPSLANGFTTTTYAFNSVAFSDGGNFVLTYAGVPTGPDGFISTGATTLGITDSDLYQQVRQSGIPLANYGYVTAGGSTGRLLVTPATINGTPIEYTLPPTAPLGAFALISGIGVCSGC